MLRFFRSFLMVASVLVAMTCSLTAHDIPSDVTAHVFVKPAGERLELLVRVPLRAIRDLEFPAQANGYLDVEKLVPKLPDAANLWLADFVAIYEEQRRLPKPRIVATQLSLDSDRSFESFEQAVEHVTGTRLANSANVFWEQLLFDVLLEYDIRSDRSRFSIRPGLEMLAARVVTVVRFVAPGGIVRAYEFVGDPGLVPLDPRWHQAARRFVELGFLHILEGTDHLLFLACVVIPFRRFRELLGVVTAFSVAHSITLIASAYDMAPDVLWFPPLIETMIAASIVYMAIENIVSGVALRRRWLMAFGFGLVHSFGFSFALRQTLQFAGSHLLTSLVAFNVGVELGQVLVLLLLIPLLVAAFRFVVAERMGIIILSVLVGHTAWHWLLERGDHLRRFSFEWPAFNSATLAVATRWLTLFLAVVGLTWLATRMRIHWDQRRNSTKADSPKPIR